MIYLIGEIFIWLLPAFLLGLWVGYWIWGKSSVEITANTYSGNYSVKPEQAIEKLPTFLTTPVGNPDDLRLIKGVGEKLNALLNSSGIFHFRQIANWTEEEVTLVNNKLEMFKGRIERDQWIEQAKLLSENRIDEFNARFGEVGSELKNG
jgi:predicted flap endonuclease-1-like 5' DNA nuclease